MGSEMYCLVQGMPSKCAFTEAGMGSKMNGERAEGGGGLVVIIYV